MAGKSVSQEYEFSESEDSPLKPFRSVASLSAQKSDTCQNGRSCVTLSTEQSETESDICENDFIEPSHVPDSDLDESDTHQFSINIHMKDDEYINEGRGDASGPLTENNKASNHHNIPDYHVKTNKHSVVYMCSKQLVHRCDQMLKIPNRARLVANLIAAYRLHQFVSIEEPPVATFDELCAFHSHDYLNFLQQLSEHDDTEKYDEEAQTYGLSYDCPAHPGVFEYTAHVSGATLHAARCLVEDRADVAINWFGGWHHGKKDSASGFCYTNDIVLGILKLRERFSRVLYVDLDLHHGDGVEDAFSSTNKVMTVSVHKQAVGFFPGTGSVKDVGYGKGKYYSVNIPLKDGIRDAEFAALVCRVLLNVRGRFQPDVIVCQCGADGLAGDPMESFNLTPKALGKCIYTMLSWKLPLLLLGGGGYNHANTARCWAYLTGIVVGRKLPTDIPEHQYLMEYGPHYELDIAPGNMKDQNTHEYLQAVYSQINYNLSHI